MRTRQEVAVEDWGLSIVLSTDGVLRLTMAHWNAYYKSSQTGDDQYSSPSTTVSAAASHFKSRMQLGHTVANISGAFAGSQP